jgi:hypothetical protein
MTRYFLSAAAVALCLASLSGGAVSAAPGNAAAINALADSNAAVLAVREHCVRRCTHGMGSRRTCVKNCVNR